MPRLTSSQFMQALPAATRARLPAGLRKFQTAHRSWLCQFYYRDPNLHYEVWNLGQTRGKLELGLHFESRNHDANLALLQGISCRIVQVKATLRPQREAEQWDRRRTKA